MTICQTSVAWGEVGNEEGRGAMDNLVVCVEMSREPRSAECTLRRSAFILSGHRLRRLDDSDGIDSSVGGISPDLARHVAR